MRCGGASWSWIRFVGQRELIDRETESQPRAICRVNIAGEIVLKYRNGPAQRDKFPRQPWTTERTDPGHLQRVPNLVSLETSFTLRARPAPPSGLSVLSTRGTKFVVNYSLDEHPIKRVIISDSGVGKPNYSTTAKCT